MSQSQLLHIDNFYLPELNRRRTIRIYLPPDYNETNRHYPVIYMHDGQNLFEKTTSSFGSIWDVRHLLDDVYHHDERQAYIVVGIDNGGLYRYEEYCPWTSTKGGEYLPHAKKTNRLGGKGFEYLQFLAETLKPYIDTHYQTLTAREHTAMMGSSMGGLISICGGLFHSNVFHKVAALSTAAYFAEEQLIQAIYTSNRSDTLKLYLDVGTNETSDATNLNFPHIYLDSNQHVFDALRQTALPHDQLRFNVIEGGAHHEDDWRKRFIGIVQWLFHE